MRLFTYCLVRGPKYPAAGVIPTERWNDLRDSRVNKPNLLVSLPGDPGPLVVSVKPSMFKSFCRSLTSLF